MLVYDNDSNPQTWGWLTNRYGSLKVLAPENVKSWFELVEVRESQGPASVTAVVLGLNGEPLNKVAVAFSWPSAPIDLTTSDAAAFKSRWRDRAVVQWTDVSGHTGFGMGTGSYYTPPGGGPHACWILHNLHHSQALDGIGMLAGTPHWTTGRLTFQLREGEPSNGNGNNGGSSDVAAVVTELKSLNLKVQKLSEHLGVR